MAKIEWSWVVSRVYVDREDAQERADRLTQQFPGERFRVAGSRIAGFGVQKQKERTRNAS
jgi:hypothetical protein